MLNASDIADFFIGFANQCRDDSMTNLKLNKLMFYAQGHYLAATGEKLFDDDIEAWELGPVVPSIYRKYKPCGRNRIAEYDTTIPKDCFTEEQYAILLDVAREYSKFTSFYLVERTHRPGTPWEKYYTNGERHVAIPADEIKAYFSTSEKIISFDEILANSSLTAKKGHRDADGVLAFSEISIDDDWLILDEM